ncbi:hypothetical protein [Crenobacter cavernae]|uniref:Uncharacterized protein n=1 Tax=Crenobacter cavernae TaxID=2290923 RepID=A0A345Y868_9NEIS|nr:hypothetical protein [Crenobacter cavernae]AXK40120.1 hypothetical protein DWG20_12060 [Crenobacter cavernae]
MGMTGQESARQTQVPQDLGAFVRVVTEWLSRNARAAFTSAVVGAALGYAINALLLIFVYGGHQVAPGALAFGQGNALWGSLGFALGGMVIGGLAGYWRTVGTQRFFHDLSEFPAALGLIFKRDGEAARVHLLWGAAVSLVAATLVSPWVGLFLAAGLMSSLPSILGRLVSALLLRLWSDLVRHAAPSRSRHPVGVPGVTVGLLGGALALCVGFVLPGALPKLAFAAACAIAALILSRRIPPSAAALLAFVELAWLALGFIDPAFAQRCVPGECVPGEMGAWSGEAHHGATVDVPAVLGQSVGGGLAAGLGAGLGAGVGSVLGAPMAGAGGGSGPEPKAPPSRGETGFAPPDGLATPPTVPDHDDTMPPPDLPWTGDAPLTTPAVLDGAGDLPDPDLPWRVPDTTVTDDDVTIPPPDLPWTGDAPLTASAVLDGAGDLPDPDSPWLTPDTIGDLPDPSGDLPDLPGATTMGDLPPDQAPGAGGEPTAGAQGRTAAEPFPGLTWSLEDDHAAQAEGAQQTLDLLGGMLTDVFWNIPKGLGQRAIAGAQAGGEFLTSPGQQVRAVIALARGGIALGRSAYSGARAIGDAVADAIEDATTPSNWTNLAGDLWRSPGVIVGDTIGGTVTDTAAMVWKGLHGAVETSWDRLKAAGDRTHGRDVIDGLWDGLVGAAIGVTTVEGVISGVSAATAGVSKLAGAAKGVAGIGEAAAPASGMLGDGVAAASAADDAARAAAQGSGRGAQLAQGADDISASGAASALDDTVPPGLPDSPGPATPPPEAPKVPEIKHLTDQQQIDLLDKANALLAKAEAAEPAITQSIQTTTEAMGGQMEGLKDRLKRPGSLVEKIAKDATRKGLSVEAAADNIADTVRYTSIFPPEKLADGTVAVLKKFADEGYQIVELKNTWPDALKSYKGINAQLRSPTGQLMEVQFHTAESLWAKGPGTHHLFEEMRKLIPADRSNPAWALLDDEQWKISNALARPDKIDKIPSIPKKQGP